MPHCSVAPTRPARLRLVAVALVALGIAGCGGPPANDASTAQNLPAWDGAQRDLFDDGVAPEVLDLGLPSAAPLRSDKVFRARAKASDGIVRARVRTVSGPNPGYTLVLAPLERLGGKRAPTADLSLVVDRGARASALIRAHGDQLVGKTVVVFVRAFSGANGEPTWHGFLAPDTKEVEAAVKDAIALEEIH